MNIVYRLFCRTYQGVFRLAQPFLPYREPHIFSSVQDIPTILKKLHISSVLLVTGPALRCSGITAPLEQLLQNEQICCAVYDTTNTNPTVQNVEQARALYLCKGCQALIAFGGGSSIDCAKATGARIAYPKRTLNRLKGLLRVLRPIPPLIAIPTTAGTGSEVTVTAVITDSEKKHKYTMNSFSLIPAYAVLDAGVTYSLPPRLTATTGMDALTHAVEAYIGRSATPETRRLALKAVELIFQNIETAYNQGENHVARSHMLLAAYKAGIAFSKSYVGYIHAVAHSLGGQYNTPHGLANSVLLPIVLENYGSCIHKKLRKLALAAGIATPEHSAEEAAQRFIAAIRQLNKHMQIPEKLSGIRQEDIPHMARHAAQEANPLYPVPKLMNAHELERLYELAADWN